MAQSRKRAGIANVPVEREFAEQRMVPPRGQSTIGKGRNRKPVPPKTRRNKSA